MSLLVLCDPVSLHMLASLGLVQSYLPRGLVHSQGPTSISELTAPRLSLSSLVPSLCSRLPHTSPHWTLLQAIHRLLVVRDFPKTLVPPPAKPMSSLGSSPAPPATLLSKLEG